ncbi:MAG: hypothetical protein ACLR1V_01280 [Coprococcus sp.]
MVAERMGVEALCQVSKVNGSCHLKMVDAGVSGCYHYYMSDEQYHYMGICGCRI